MAGTAHVRSGRWHNLLGAEAVHLEYPTRGLQIHDRRGQRRRPHRHRRTGWDGKSSLLGLLSGRVAPDSGRVTQRSGLRVGALSQADTLDSASTVR